VPATYLDRVKRVLRIPAGVTVHDTRITEIVGEVDEELLDQLGLSAWDSSTVYNDNVDVFPGTPGQTVILKRFAEFMSIVALTASGVRLVENQDFRLDDGGVIRLLNPGATFDYMPNSVQVTYTCGHIAAGSTPAWLLRVASLSAARQYNLEPMGAIGSLRVDPITRTMADLDHDAAEGEIRRTLARWLRPGT
jgi:hypothetical protein